MSPQYCNEISVSLSISLLANIWYVVFFARPILLAKHSGIIHRLDVIRREAITLIINVGWMCKVNPPSSSLSELSVYISNLKKPSWQGKVASGRPYRRTSALIFNLFMRLDCIINKTDSVSSSFPQQPPNPYPSLKHFTQSITFPEFNIKHADALAGQIKCLPISRLI